MMAHVLIAHRLRRVNSHIERAPGPLVIWPWRVFSGQPLSQYSSKRYHATPGEVRHVPRPQFDRPARLAGRILRTTGGDGITIQLERQADGCLDWPDTMTVRPSSTGATYQELLARRERYAQANDWKLRTGR